MLWLAGISKYLKPRTPIYLVVMAEGKFTPFNSQLLFIAIKCWEETF